MTRDLLETYAAIERPEVRPEGLAVLDDLRAWLRATGSALRDVRLLAAGDPGPRVREVAADLRVGVALAAMEATTALDAAAGLVDAAVDEGCDLVVLAAPEPGPGALAAVGLLCRKDASLVTGHRPGGLDDQAWMSDCAAVRDRMRQARPALGDPAPLLQSLGDAGLSALTGALLQAALRRTPVLLDGVTAAAAALVARRVTYRCLEWCRAADHGGHPAEALARERLGVSPLLDLQAPTGLGGVLAVPILRAAATGTA